MRSKLYKGRIEHHRYWPVDHRFAYGLYVYALDLDELPVLDRKLPLFGYNRHRIAAIFDRDYLYREPGTIRDKLKRCLAMEGVHAPPHRVVLITSPRYLNYVFNPVSFYYCYGPEDRLICVVAEVNNTYGERHIYVLKKPLAGNTGNSRRYTAEKAFHVSPYNRIEGRYEFTFPDPGPLLDITIKLNRRKKTIFKARLTGHAIALTAASQFKTMLKNPMVPHLSIPRIYWEAFMLHFLKKLPFNDRPVPVNPKTIPQETPPPAQAVSRKVFFAHLERISEGHIKLRSPDGKVKIFGNPQSPPEGEIRVRDNRFFSRSVIGGEIGFGESYMAGEWDTPNLPKTLGVIISNRDDLAEGNWLTSIISDGLESLSHHFKKNLPPASRANISRHYDLGNDFFRLFLDETMTYSCAFFQSESENLSRAQKNKYQKIIEKADIQPSDHVLEIGCGWGGFALAAARATGCRVTAATISEQQYQYVTKMVAREGLDDRIHVRLEDYRHIRGSYDKIVSIEMLEAVGHQYLGVFFRTCDRLLKKNGLIVIQTIINSDQRYVKEYKKSDWIKKHIFPGGQVPSLTAICTAMTRQSTLLIQDVENIGDHYALTLNRWRRAFLEKERELAAMNFEPSFRRKWEYYLAICEAAFATRALRDLQIVIARQGSTSPRRCSKQ